MNEDGIFKSEVFFSEKGLSEVVEFIDSAREALNEDVIHISTEKFGTPVEIATHLLFLILLIKTTLML